MWNTHQKPFNEIGFNIGEGIILPYPTLDQGNGLWLDFRDFSISKT